VSGQAPRGLALVAVAPDDRDELLALNQAHVPHVGALDRARLTSIVEQCSLALVARDPGSAGALGPVLGMVLVLGPGADYDSPNYRWFADRHDEFRYVDRIAVAPGGGRRGLGRALYGAVFDHARSAGAPIVCAEVNLDPPNPDSIAFHTAMGFAEVGQQDTYEGSVRVSLMVAPV
jgi:predicted GNAT superfamily acetyltransferase